MRFRVFIIFLSLLDPFVTCFDLKCTSTTAGFGYLGTINYCIATSLTITSPNETITSVNGVTTPTTLEGLYVPNMVVHYLPKGIEKFFPQLRGLSVHAIGLKSIQAADLEGLSNLECLHITENAIEELSSDLFKFTPKINEVNFNSNQINRVGKDILTNLQNLKSVNFSGNKCISSETTSDFENMKNELRIKCPHPTDEMGMEIEALKSQKSSMEVEISELRTENDRLKRTWYNGLLDSSTKLLHKVTKKLEECRTGKTAEENVEIGAEVVLKVMRVTEDATVLDMNVESPESRIAKIVDASGNEVYPNQTEIVVDQQNTLFLPVNLGQLFPLMERLSVTFSGLYGLNNRTFFGIQNLVAINFTGNKLVEISEYAFAALASLKELDLSNNNIEVIHDAAFEQNVDLEILRLSHNQLTAISSPIFRHQKKLRILFLNENKLKFINGLLLSASKALEVFDLRNNECIDSSNLNSTLNEIESIIIDQCNAPVELKCSSLTKLGQTEETSCQNAELTIIVPRTQIFMESDENAKTIVVLDIIDQKMFFMPSMISKTLPNLTQLTIGRSQLTALHKTDFKGLTSLKVLTIALNNISLIEEGVFDEVPLIGYPSLASNHIESLPPKAFVKLMRLHTLDLSGNKLKRFSANILPKQPVINEISLRENLLEIIDHRIIKMLKNTDLIDFSDNSCINIQYQQSHPKSNTFNELSNGIVNGCTGEVEED